MTKMHGAAAYKRGCRCNRCREANTIRCLELRTRRIQRMAQTQVPHGSASTYNNWGCRCQPCSDAHSQRCAEYKKRKKTAKTELSEARHNTTRSDK